MQKAVQSGLPFVVQKMKIWRFIMADERTEKQKVQEITDKLEEGLKELFESEKYKTYLSIMSKFHNYSFNNTLLIAMQRPEATLVAGYKEWQKNFERHVNKGEKAIRILAPAPYKIKEERDKLDPVTGEMMFDENGMSQKEQVEVTIPAFRAVYVFDVSQTDGKPIPELEAQELLSTVEGYEDFVQALMNVATVPIGFEDIPGDSKGAWVTLLGGEKTEEVEEYHLDYIYNTDTRKIRDVKELQQMQEKSLEPVNASDVIVKVTGSMGSEYETDKIINMTAEQVKGILYDMAMHEENEWDGNVQDYLRERGAECIPIMASDGLNDGYPQFYDFEYNADAGEITAVTELSVMEQAENLINRLEFGATVYMDDERDLIVNYAYKLDDMDKTRELAERLAYQIENEPVNEPLTVIDARAEINALPDPMIGLSEMCEYG